MQHKSTLKMATNNCIFCQICAKTAAAAIQYEDDEIIVFNDIKPASDQHLLCIPKQHIPNVKSLTQNDRTLVLKLIECGKNVLRTKNCDLSDTLMGFHWPPFNSVQHLHLHVISPASKMNFLSRQIFRPHALWFVTADYVLEYIRSKL